MLKMRTPGENTGNGEVFLRKFYLINMNTELLTKHIKKYLSRLKENSEKYQSEINERREHLKFYCDYTEAKLMAMDPDKLYEYLSKLWAMLIWGNKRYVVEKIISDNGLENVKKSLVYLLWSKDTIEKRWDYFRKSIKGMGPAMMSEILCKTHPNNYMIWNRRAYAALNYLGVEDLPIYNYQFDGKMYSRLCSIAKEMAEVLKKEGVEDYTMLGVDYFIWDELQVEDNLSTMHTKKTILPVEEIKESTETATFIHNEIRDKLADIGTWLGFIAKTEQIVSGGSKVDTIWEAVIGNMGRVIYIFEVQTKGSIDSLILNLLKSLKNPAVQGVVAVSDKQQLEKIRKHAEDVKDLKDKLKYWDYEEILRVHESLYDVNSIINTLGLVPQGF